MDEDNRFVVRRSQNRPGKFGVFKGLDPAKGANMRARREARAGRTVDPQLAKSRRESDFYNKPVTPPAWDRGERYGDELATTASQPVRPPRTEPTSQYTMALIPIPEVPGANYADGSKTKVWYQGTLYPAQDFWNMAAPGGVQSRQFPGR